MRLHESDHPPDPEGPPDPSRRAFLRRLGGASVLALGAAAGGVAIWQPRHHVPGFEVESAEKLKDYRVAAAPGRPVLAVARDQERGPAIRAAVDKLGSMGRFIRRGDVVLIKPNVAFDRPPALGATTHPDALRAVALLAREAGAARILVADNPINHPQGCFEKTGLSAVAAELGLEIIYPNPSAFKPVRIGGVALESWPVFLEPLRRADKVIGLAAAKDHNLAGASLTLKNWYGLLGGGRNRLHQRIDDVVADFALMIRPTLVILDGFSVLAAHGPTGGRLTDVKVMNTIIAGTDMVAVDACGVQLLLERDPKSLGWLRRAHERGLGRMDWAALSV